MKIHGKMLVASLLAVAISGCAVHSQPVGKAESLQRAQADLKAMYADQEPLSGPLTLHEAMARAVKYNLEARLKVMEEAMAMRQADLVSYDMLPRMALNAGYAGRSNMSASSSRSIETGRQSLEPSTSLDRDREVADLTMVWNVLDFGVGYVSARQQSNQRLIVEERRRKVVHTIVQDVRSAYWRAQAAEKLLKQIDGLMQRVDVARSSSEQMSSKRIGDPVQALAYQRDLIQATRQLEEQRRALSLAKTELATLINLPMGSDFTLASDDSYEVPLLAESIEQLEEEALSTRPELREQDYQTRISCDETRKAMLRMLPGLEFSVGGNYDSNSFLVNQSWADYGVRVTWNLFNLLSGPQAVEVAKAGEQVTDARRQALSIAVLAQLHVARANYQDALQRFKSSQQLAGIEQQIAEQLRSRKKVGGTGELELIQGELSALRARLQQDLVYAELRNAHGQLYMSAGRDPLPEQAASASVADLAAAMASREAVAPAGEALASQ